MKTKYKCPDCHHERKYHLNTVGCCFPIGKHPNSYDEEGKLIFKGATDYCYCQRISGFTEKKGLVGKLKQK